jgi:hypothetical protein
MRADKNIADSKADLICAYRFWIELSSPDGWATKPTANMARIAHLR